MPMCCLDKCLRLPAKTDYFSKESHISVIAPAFNNHVKKTDTDVVRGNNKAASDLRGPAANYDSCYTECSVAAQKH